METSTFPCPSCKGSLKFEPGIMSLQCPYCGTQVHPPQNDIPEIIEELDFEKALLDFNQSSPTEMVQVVDCPACKAEVTFRNNETTANCDFCGTPIQAQGQPHKAMLPQYLIPFQIQKSQAMDTFRQWIGKGFFAPNSLGRLTRTNSEGKTVSVRVRHTRWHPVEGQVARSFHDLLIAASRTVPQSLTRRLSQWDFSKLLNYNTQYLSGFKAESYSIELSEGFHQAQEVLKPLIRSDIRRDIGGDEQQILNMRTQYSSITFKYLLLPLWTMKYQFKKKFYSVVVNAQTGEIEGHKPVSVLKVIFTPWERGFISQFNTLEDYNMFSDQFNSDPVLELSPPEAAAALSLMVGFLDDHMEESEATIFKKYYRIETLESLESKITEAGLLFPQDLPKIQDQVLRLLSKEKLDFRLRTIGVAQLIAQGDENTTHEELLLLSRFAQALEVSLAEAAHFGKHRMLEIDERGDYYHYLDPVEEVEKRFDLSPGECGLLASTIIAFRDGELTEKEAQVARDHVTTEHLRYLKEKLEAQGVIYPEQSLNLQRIMSTQLKSFSRDTQLSILAVARKTAEAEGLCEEEREMLQSWCEELGIGMLEVESYFKAFLLL